MALSTNYAVAAVGLANQVLMLVYMVFMIGVMGVTVVCSQYIGAKDEHGFVKTISAAVAYNIFVGIVTGIFFTFFTPELIVFLDTRAELVNALDLGSSGAFLKSSSLFSRTIKFFDRSKAPKSATSSGTIYKESQNVPHH